MIALVAIAYTGEPSARELLDRRNGERQPDELDRRVAGWEGAPKMTADVRCFDPAEASERELADYYRLVLDTGKVDRPDEQPPPYESVVARLRTPLTSRGPSRFWAAYLDGRLIGMANFGFPDNENGHLVIGEIRVHPDQRGRGFGTALLRAALPTMRMSGDVRYPIQPALSLISEITCRLLLDSGAAGRAPLRRDRDGRSSWPWRWPTGIVARLAVP